MVVPYFDVITENMERHSVGVARGSRELGSTTVTMLGSHASGNLREVWGVSVSRATALPGDMKCVTVRVVVHVSWWVIRGTSMTSAVLACKVSGVSLLLASVELGLQRLSFLLYFIPRLL